MSPDLGTVTLLALTKVVDESSLLVGVTSDSVIVKPGISWLRVSCRVNVCDSGGWRQQHNRASRRFGSSGRPPAQPPRRRAVGGGEFGAGPLALPDAGQGCGRPGGWLRVAGSDRGAEGLPAAPPCPGAGGLPRGGSEGRLESGVPDLCWKPWVTALPLREEKTLTGREPSAVAWALTGVSGVTSEQSAGRWRPRTPRARSGGAGTGALARTRSYGPGHGVSY